jgi:purine catabolism regulator
MVLSVAELVARPELHLSVAAGARHLDRRIRTAHVSELVRPGRWLQGDEVLLMTTALLIPMDPGVCRAYLDDLTTARASALVLGLGSSLPYQQAPAALVSAAEEAGLPLLTVPDEVPFMAITKVVFATQAAEQLASLERAFETQRQLTAAAASGHGLTPTLEAWTQATGVPAAVSDPLGRLIAAAGGNAQRLLDDNADLIHKVAARGMHGSGSNMLGTTRAEVQPLGARRLRGVLVLDGRAAPEAQLLTSGLVSLLSLELERRHLADEPERRRRSALLGRLLAEGTTGEQARDVMTVTGLSAEAVRGVAVEALEDAAEIAADLALAVPGGLIRTRGGVVEAVVGEDLDIRESLDRFASGCPAGIGALVTPEAASASLRQAVGLLAVSRSVGKIVEARESGSSRLLLSLGNRATLAGYADALLGVIDAADPGGELVETLATWLDTGSSWEETSRLLGVHRHTVRNRLDKTMRLTGRRLDNGDDRFDLWLAVRARQTAQHGAASGTSPPAA